MGKKSNGSKKGKLQTSLERMVDDRIEKILDERIEQIVEVSLMKLLLEASNDSELSPTARKLASSGYHRLARGAKPKVVEEDISPKEEELA